MNGARDKIEPAMVRYVKLTLLGEHALDEMECKHRLKLHGMSIENFYCGKFNLMITIAACAICKSYQSSEVKPA